MRADDIILQAASTIGRYSASVEEARRTIAPRILQGLPILSVELCAILCNAFYKLTANNYKGKSMADSMNDLSKMIDEYRLSVLCGEEESEVLASVIRQQLTGESTDGSPPEELEAMLAQARKEGESHKEEMDCAYRFGRQGIAKESIEFQEYLSGIRAKGDTLLVEAALYSHDQGWDEWLALQSEEGDAGGYVTADVSIEQLMLDFEGNVFKEKNDDGISEDARREIEERKKDILRYRTWRDDATKMKELNEAVERIAQLDAKAGDEARQMLDEGRDVVRLLGRASKLGRQSFGKRLPKTDKTLLASLEEEMERHELTGSERNKIYKQFEGGWRCAKKGYEKFISSKHKKSTATPGEETTAKSPTQESCTGSFLENQTSHPLFLGNLTWSGDRIRIFIDETGNKFDSSIFEPNVKKCSKGKIVALFLSQDAKLPPIEYSHATDNESDNNFKLISSISTQKEGCAILGINLDAMPRVDLDYWFIGLERLFDLTLRLLPEPKEKVILEFFIENRGDNSPVEVAKREASIKHIADGSLYRYAKTFQTRAEMIELKIHTISKKEAEKAGDHRTPVQEEFIKYNGYVDVLAWAWGTPSKDGEKELRRLGLLHRCMLEGDVQELPFVLDRIAQEESIPFELWNKLLDSPDLCLVDSIPSLILEKLARITREKPHLWESYAEEVVRHLNSKAICLWHLSRQLDWLTKSMPPTAKMSKRLRLIWLTSKLADANHHGEVNPYFLNETRELIADLFVEDAPLCCWAALNFAVERTNAYNFKEAKQCLLDFTAGTGLLNDTPPFLDYLDTLHKGQCASFDSKVAIFGLAYTGQLLSSLGQHEAFLGNHEMANSYFDAAIECFTRLSDGSPLDIEQTMSYKVTNLMDYRAPASIRPQVESYLGGNLVDMARKFAVSTNDSEKYRHAVMMRYFATLPKDDPAIVAYLSLKNNWTRKEDGHPWEMIEFYRGMLLDGSQDGIDHLKYAYKLLEGEKGLTLKVISIVIRASICYYERNMPGDSLLEEINFIEKALPGLGKKRIDALREQLTNPMAPLELAKIILPFNFR